jgi:hypothetical protein
MGLSSPRAGASASPRSQQASKTQKVGASVRSVARSSSDRSDAQSEANVDKDVKNFVAKWPNANEEFLLGT